MEANSLIIEKKKIGNLIVVVFCLFIILMFSFASIATLINGEVEYSYEYIFILFFLLLSFFGLRSMIAPIRKLFSSKPEFELTEKELRIFDNPHYDSIPLSDIIESKIYRAKYNTMIGISLKQNSNIITNVTRLQLWAFKIPEEKSNIVFISLNFAKIKPRELVNLLNESIRG